MSDKTLLHYADKPMVFDRARVYMQDEPHQFHKPKGLWVSVAGEDDWEAWCRAEEFRLTQLQCVHRVTLSPAANILWIADADALEQFHAVYSVGTEFEEGMR